jgi:hypothetical protein
VQNKINFQRYISYNDNGEKYPEEVFFKAYPGKSAGNTLIKREVP